MCAGIPYAAPPLADDETQVVWRVRAGVFWTWPHAMVNGMAALTLTPVLVGCAFKRLARSREPDILPMHEEEEPWRLRTDHVLVKVAMLSLSHGKHNQTLRERAKLAQPPQDQDLGAH
jgi:hypothetical protein